MAKKDLKIEEDPAQIKCLEQIEELTNRWKRALADYQNLEKRYERDRSDFVQFANANLILRLISVLGHLEKVSGTFNDKGLELVVSELQKVLNEEGLEELESLGKEFDPNFMEAVEVLPGEEENKVAEVVSKGYLFKGKLLVPAKVKVFKNEPTNN